MAEEQESKTKTVIAGKPGIKKMVTKRAKAVTGIKRPGGPPSAKIKRPGTTTAGAPAAAEEGPGDTDAPAAASTPAAAPAAAAAKAPARPPAAKPQKPRCAWAATLLIIALLLTAASIGILQLALMPKPEMLEGSLQDMLAKAGRGVDGIALTSEEGTELMIAVEGTIEKATAAVEGAHRTASTTQQFLDPNGTMTAPPAADADAAAAIPDPVTFVTEE